MKFGLSGLASHERAVSEGRKTRIVVEEDRMHSRNVTALGLAGLLALSGCAAMEERRWDGCALAGGLIGAAIGGAAGGVLVHE